MTSLGYVVLIINSLPFFSYYATSTLDCKDIKQALRNNETGEPLNDGTRLIFFEVSKFLNRVNIPNNKMERWLAYFANVGGKKMEQIAEQEPGIKAALTAEEIFTQSRESYLAYMHDWKLIMEERSYKAQLSAVLEQAAVESEAPS